MNMNNINIEDRIIGKDHPLFIIAEAGVNHNGSIDIAKKLVDEAANAGADAIKFQTYKSENVVSNNVKSADYVKQNLGKEIDQKSLLKKYELKYDDFKILKNYCDTKNIIFLSTPHSFDAIDFLEPLVPAYKFGSGDITNIPSLVYAASKGKPLIIGTGMSTLDEVKRAVKEIKKTGNQQIILLHCTTSYPCPIEQVNLNAMKTMQKELGCLVGYSDHTLDTLVPVIARSMGAVILEKHFTLDRGQPGPDHKASLEPVELKKMVQDVRRAEIILGSNIKKPTDDEEKIKKIVRKSIVAGTDIEKGTIIKENMFSYKRPGTGINPSEINKLIARKAKRKISENELIDLNMIE